MIYYDITDILEFARHHDTLSGIQRVSIQLLNHMVNKHGTDRLRLIGWNPSTHSIMTFDAGYFAGNYKYDAHDFCRHFALSRVSLTRIVELRLYRRAKYWRRPLHYGWRLLKSACISAVPRSPRPTIGHSAGQFPKRGDVVFIGGATWNFDRYQSALANMHREGVAICQFIHDLFPLVAPEHVVDEVPRHFLRWLDHLSRNADFLLTNSKATKRDLDRWLAARGVEVPSRVLPLAHQFVDRDRQPAPDDGLGAGPPPGEPAPGSEVIHACVRNAARLPYALCVGTLEPRKNIWMLAQVWREIHAKLGTRTPRLIFAGKPGWLKDDFDDFISGTGSLYGYIRIVEGPNDAELEYLYRNCLFSVFPSYKEGWGLPIGESLWLGRPVVCSNTSAMPEVGGGLADYINPHSCESMEAVLMKMITDVGYRERRAAEIAAAPLRAWADVADDLWDELAATAAHPRHAGRTAAAAVPLLALQQAG